MASEASPLLPQEGNTNDAPAAAAAPPKRDSRVRNLAIFFAALIVTAAAVFATTWVQHGQQTKPRHGSAKRNLVFMVSDGMGPASLALTRGYRQHVEKLPISDVLTLDKHFWGSSRTRSSNSLVTDSAAGATAFSCGKKSYNGAISVLPDYSPCGTVLEAAKKAGYSTGLVVTTAITDATPACFASHVLRREMQGDIALQEIGEGPLGRTVDLMLGGGRCNFLPNTTEGSCRLDDTDVTKLAQEQYGWAYTDNRAGFDALDGGENVQLPTLGLFAGYDFPFAIDREHLNDTYPSLIEMTRTALRALELATADSDKGFFLMIEGSRIDHAGHNNDPASQVREVLEYDAAFKTVLDFIEQSEVETVLVSTSDHETGGLATALQEPGHLPVYNWYPRVLHNATHSTEFLAAKLQAKLRTADFGSQRALKKWINEELIIRGLGIPNATDKELDQLAEQPENALVILSAIISLRAHIGWSTHGHTAVDVNIYSSGGAGTENIRGNVENIEVGHFLSNYLDVDVEGITKELLRKSGLNNLRATDNLGMMGDVTSGKYHIEETI